MSKAAVKAAFTELSTKAKQLRGELPKGVPFSGYVLAVTSIYKGNREFAGHYRWDGTRADLDRALSDMNASYLQDIGVTLIATSIAITARQHPSAAADEMLKRLIKPLPVAA